MRSEYWEKHPPTLEALAKGMGSNLSDGPCMCSRCTCHGPSETEKLDVRKREIVTWLLGSGHVKSVHETQTEKAKEMLCTNINIAGQLCQAAEMGNNGRMAAELHHLDCISEVKSIIATELLMIACQHGKLDVVRCLIEDWGADQFGESVVGGNALTYAAGSGQMQVVVYLLSEEPGSIDFPCQDGFTPMMFATFWSRLGVMSYLLSNEADLSLEDKFGRTALSYAALYGNVDAINCLCEGGSDIYHTDNDEKTPLELAKSYSRCVHVIAALSRWQKTACLRQKLKDRTPKTTVWNSMQSRDGEIDRKIADLHMEELIREIEEEEVQKTRKREKKGKKKKRGGVKPDACSSMQQEDELTNMHRTEKAENRYLNKKKGENIVCLKSPGKNQDCGAFSSGDVEVDSVDSKGGMSVVPKQSAKNDPTYLREYWGFIVQDAAKCTAPDKQVEYLQRIPNLMKECQASGISTKYGKKILSRLERVGSGRKQLELAVSSGDPSGVCAALSNAKGLQSLIDPKLWLRAEAIAEQQQVQTSDTHHICKKTGGMNLNEHSALCAVISGSMQQEYESWDLHSQVDGPASGTPSQTGQIQAFSQEMQGPYSYRYIRDQNDGSLSSLHNTSIENNGEVNARKIKPEEGLEKETECMVCMESRKSACCVPCGHISMCYTCANEVHNKTGVCPICRSPISFVMRIQ